MSQTILDLEPRAVSAPTRRRDPPPVPHWMGLVCPVARVPLGGSADCAPVVDTLTDGSSQVVVSLQASRGRAGCNWTAAMAQWRHLETGHGAAIGGLGLAAWRRWAVLLSFTTALGDVDAARLPLAVMPPPGVKPLHALQRLQLLITQQLSSPGWSGRLRALAEGLAERQLREDFQLFVGALAPRLLELPGDRSPLAEQQSLEDLWLDATVRRRWQHLAIQLGSAGAERLLRQAWRLSQPEVRLAATSTVRGARLRYGKTVAPLRSVRAGAWPLV